MEQGFTPERNMTTSADLIHAIADALIEAHGQDATEWLDCGGRAAVERDLARWRVAIADGAWIDRPEDILEDLAPFRRFEAIVRETALERQT